LAIKGIALKVWGKVPLFDLADKVPYDIVPSFQPNLSVALFPILSDFEIGK
jgi:hypothetical protein